MTDKDLNKDIKKYLGLVEQKKVLEKQVDAMKNTLMNFHGIKTDKFSIFVAVTESERVVGKDVLIEKLGLNFVQEKELLKKSESKSLKIEVL